MSFKEQEKQDFRQKAKQDFKQTALSLVRKKDYEGAKLYLSLAYEKKPTKSLLNLIELCEFALNSPDEGDLLFEFYMKHCKVRSIDREFEKILDMSENSKSLALGDDGALSWADFLQSEREIGFQKSFENVIFANKLVISSKNDFLTFLEKLLDNGYKDTTLNYIESVAGHFAGDEHFMRLQEKLRGMA